jgi:hypothetical protein
MTQETIPFPLSAQRGNAAIYVLIVVALFAALSMIVARQHDNSESNGLSKEKLEIVANQVIAYPYQVKQAVEMMTMSGTDPSDLLFILPGEPGFSAGSPVAKVFHPEGGGLILARLPDEAIAQTSTDPVAGWYLGQFNNVAWTPTVKPDVMLVAHQISQDVCKSINKELTGSDAIPAMTDTIPDVLIDDSRHGGTNVAEFDASICPDCENLPAICVSNGGQYGFYSIILSR